eukprot:g6241.t1
MSQKGLSGMMASLNPFAKSSKGRNNGSGGTGGGRGGAGRGAEVPRSFGINGGPARSSSERLPVTGEGPAGEGIARRSSETAASNRDHGSAGGDFAAAAAMAPKTTVGLKESKADEDSPSVLYAGRATDIELGFPADLIIEYWKKKEDSKFTKKMARSTEPPPTYPPHRRYMVDWLSEVGEQLDLQTVTIHSAVSFLDELMVLTDYSTRDWHLYAVCCLNIAAKYEEAECNMPMISELADATEMSLTTPIVTRGELDLVQNRLEWDVSRVTAMHFLGYYTSQGVTMPEDTCQGRRLVEKVVMYMNKYVDFFANLCQQDYQFQRYKPSHIAAAAILAARRALCIKPVWRDELTELTGYKLEEVVECGEELWNFYEKMFPHHRPLRTDASTAKKAAAVKQQQQQQQQAGAPASGAGGADPGSGAAPSSGSNPAIGANPKTVAGEAAAVAAAEATTTAAGQ